MSETPRERPVDRDAARTVPPKWWITTDRLVNGGKRKLGPFSSREDAMTARNYVELVEKPVTYWVDCDE